MNHGLLDSVLSILRQITLWPLLDTVENIIGWHSKHLLILISYPLSESILIGVFPFKDTHVKTKCCQLTGSVDASNKLDNSEEHHINLQCQWLVPSSPNQRHSFLHSFLANSSKLPQGQPSNNPLFISNRCTSLFNATSIIAGHGYPKDHSKCLARVHQ